ncbi:MAG: peptidyl-prolyl cis-trans isomerase [Verrucomicrobiales bacterium]
MKRFFGEPLVQFLLIGGCIYGAFFLFGDPEEEVNENRVYVDEARIGSMISQWESRWNRPPTRQEIDGLIDSYVKEEILYRQAVTMGLGEDDPITRRRMAQKLEFLTSDLASAVQPAEGELEKYLADNEASYRSPDQITLTQVFFNPDERKDATIEDANAELKKLRAAGEPDPKTLEAGDSTMVKSHFVSSDQAGIARQMGGGFAESVMQLESGQWHGPVLSGYGVHLVYVFEVKKGTLPEFASVKDKVLENWSDEQREQFNADFIENLKSRFEIVIDEFPADQLLDAPGAAVSGNESRAEKESES